MTPDAGRRPYIAGNWKMFKTSEDARSYVKELRKLLPDDPAADVGICVPFTALAATMKAAEGSDIRVCAQNMHQEAEGAFTGEVSAPMLLEYGIHGVVLGHSERDQGETERRLRHQVQEGLERVAPEDLARVVVAYEPIWAIGTGRVATSEQAQEAIAFIRALVGDRSPDAADQVRVLYGGSVKA